MGERIIIAEDDEDLAFVLREALRRQRYDVEVAPTAGGLLDGLKAAPYDLILLDVRLPDMDGLDAIPRCRELAPDTPIIVMTAHGTMEMPIWGDAFRDREGLSDQSVKVRIEAIVRYLASIQERSS